MTRSDPLRATSPKTTTTKAFLTRAMLMALLGLLCLSNVFVQGQVVPPSGPATPPPATGPTTGPATGPATGTPTGPATGPATGTPSGQQPGTATGNPVAPVPSRSPTDPPSLLSMISPKVNNKDPPLFQIGVDLSFSWDYDKYLLLPPANLTIEAYSSDNTIVTIANAIAGSSKNFTWTAASQKNVTHPIKTNMYTLRIFDGNVGRAGWLPQGGYLATYTSLKFGLYIPGDYIPGHLMNPSVCARCDFSPITNSAMKAMVPMATLAIVFIVSSALLL
ncbi:hypothetical protein BGX24_007079 [Mortierella sp. AD032]|nr:hypothetical protein BGX24_007079 [Mortierella sp. AD032]